MRRFYILIVVAVITIIVAVLSTPLLYDKFPDDYSRLSSINQWLSDENIKPNVVVFGASNAMNSIDGNLLSRELNCKVVSYTSPGQSFTESCLFYSRLPNTVHTVIQTVSAYGGKWDVGVSDKIIDRLMIGGYRLDTISFMLSDSVSRKGFDRLNFEVYYHSRNYLKNGIHNMIRSVLEPNEDCDSAHVSLSYPYLFQFERCDDATWQKYAMQVRPPETDTIEITPAFVDAVEFASDYFKSRNINYYLVLMPVSNCSQLGIPEHYYESVRRLSEKTGVKVLDYTYSLDEEYFADPSHSNRAGAAIITKQLCEDLYK